MIIYLFIVLAIIGLVCLVWTIRELYKSAKANDWVIG